jgi:hypothetical protein
MPENPAALTPSDSQAFFRVDSGVHMASEEQKQTEGKGFTVQDRRRFSPETGEVRQDAPQETRPASDPAESKKEESEAHAQSPEQEPLPELNFSTFVISLSTQALMHLGEIGNPMSGHVETDVPMAKQMIDILVMLKDKTRGNLDSSENRLMEDILFDLRMKYVEAVKRR